MNRWKNSPIELIKKQPFFRGLTMADGSHCKIKLFKIDTVSGSGYYDLKHEEHIIKMQYYDDIERLGYKDAWIIFERDHIALERKWFGPRYYEI